MKYTTLILFAITIVTLAGCEAQNPICNDTFCITGEVFFKSELPDGTQYDTVNIDTAKLLSAIGETPPISETSKPSLPTGVSSVDIATIVSDVALGNTDYEHDWVYLEALVTEDLTDGGRSLLLETHNDSVRFRVSSFVKKSQLSQWTKGNSYGFILFISGIQTNDEGITTIFSRVDDPDNIAQGRSVLTPSPSAVLASSIDVLLESFRKGESYYIGKRVAFLDSVKIRQEDQTSSDGTVYDRLVVYYENVSLLTAGRDSFGIYQTMQLFEGEIDAKYTEGSFHNFEVTIHYLSGEDFFNPDKVSIVGYFEDKTFLP